MTKKKVTGVGGIFFKSDNPEKSREWYKNNLSLITNEYGKFVHIIDPDGVKIEL